MRAARRPWRLSRYLYCAPYRPGWFDALPGMWCSGGQLLGVAYTSGVATKYWCMTVPHRCTDARMRSARANNGGSKQRSQQTAAPLTRSHRASTPRCGAPCPRAPTWACGTLGQALGVARRAGLARTASRPRRRGSCRARCQPRTPRADQPGSARSGKPKRVRAATSAPELIGGRDTFLVPPSPSGRPDCTQRACR